MNRSTSLLALATTIALPLITGTAAACPHKSHHQVTYYSQPTTTRVIRTTSVKYQPAAVVRTASYSKAAAVTAQKTVTAQKVVAIESERAELVVGKTVTASANFLGVEQGYVFLQLGSATLQCEVLDWSANEVTFKTPNLGLRMPAKASLELVRPNGQIVRNFKIALAPKADLVEHMDSDSSTIPANIGATKPRTANASGLTLEAPSAPMSEASVLITQ